MGFSNTNSQIDDEVKPYFKWITNANILSRECARLGKVLIEYMNAFYNGHSIIHNALEKTCKFGIV